MQYPRNDLYDKPKPKPVAVSAADFGTGDVVRIHDPKALVSARSPKTTLSEQGQLSDDGLPVVALQLAALWSAQGLDHDR